MINWLALIIRVVNCDGDGGIFDRNGDWLVDFRGLGGRFSAVRFAATGFCATRLAAGLFGLNNAINYFLFWTLWCHKNLQLYLLVFIIAHIFGFVKMIMVILL